MEITGLGYIGFDSPATDAWRTFAPEVLGFELCEGLDPETVYLRIDDKHHRLAIHRALVDRLAYIGWETRDARGFDQAVNHLAKCGVRYREGTPAEIEDRFVLGMVHFDGPAGYRHEIFYGQGERYKSFYPGRRHGGFVTGDQGLGHVVLVTPTLEADHSFAEEVLGFKTILTVGTNDSGLKFYRCNPRHHCLGFLGKPGKRGLLHIMVQVQDFDDVGIALDRAYERGLTIPISLGRHPGDFMVSFYLRTPSNFDLEYGWGGLRIDNEDGILETRWFGHREVWGHHHMAGFFSANIDDVQSAKESDIAPSGQ